MRICVAYDCLYPWTVGGQERYMRELAIGLAHAGHDVTFATRTQWGPDDDPSFDGVRVVGVSPYEPLYDEQGRRTTSEPLRYARGLAGHLLRHRYDHVHTCAFPYFSLLAARAVAPNTPMTVDWPEVWSREYWDEYLGKAKGGLANAIQAACARATPRAFTISALHSERLRDAGFRGELTQLAGLYSGPLEPQPVQEPAPVVVFAGRLIPEKRATVVAEVVALARDRIPGLRGLILGDGPERAAVDASLNEWTDAGGFVSSDELNERISKAAVLLAPSSREGYGMIVVEASALGTPSVVVPGPDNAAVEQVDNGENGYIAHSEDPRDIADAVVDCFNDGMALRHRTAAWFAREAPRRRMEASIQTMLEAIGS
jgi:glycosyltransferase involved in cell wall biosynthesis